MTRQPGIPYASASFTWTKTGVVDNVGLDPAQYPVDSVLPFRPPLTAGAMLDVPVGKFRAVGRATIVGPEVVLSARFQGARTEIPSYALLGLTVSFEATPGVTLYARGENLLDKLYLTGFDRRGLSRTWTVGLRASN